MTNVENPYFAEQVAALTDARIIKVIENALLADHVNSPKENAEAALQALKDAGYRVC